MSKNIFTRSIMSSFILALTVSFFSPISPANATEQTSTEATQEDYSNPSTLEASEVVVDTANIEYVVVEGVNTVKATSNEVATGSKPLRIFNSTGALLAETYTDNKVSVNIPRSSESYYSTFGTSQSATITPFTQETLWSISLSTDKNVFKQNEVVKLSTKASHPDAYADYSGYAIYFLNQNDEVIGYRSIAVDASYDVYPTASTEEYYAVIASDVGRYNWYGKFYTELTNIKATTSKISVTKNPIQIGLNLDKSEIGAGEKAKLEYTLSYELTGDYFIYFVDDATGQIVNRQYPSTTGSIEVTFSSGDPKNYKAYIGQRENYIYNVNEITNVLAQSNIVELKRKPWSVSLVAEKPVFAVDEKGILTWETNQPLANQDSYPYYALWLYDKTEGKIIDKQLPSNSGSFHASFPTGGPHEYVIYVAKDASTYSGMPELSALEEIQTISNIASLQRKPWSVQLSADITTFRIDDNVNFTITAEQWTMYNDYYYRPYIIDTSNGNIISMQWSGVKTLFRPTELFMTGDPRDYKVVIARTTNQVSNVSELEDIQAESNIVTMTRAPWVIEPTVHSWTEWHEWYPAPIYRNNVSYEANQPLRYSPFRGGLYNITKKHWVEYSTRNGAKEARVDSELGVTQELQWIYGEPTGDPQNPIGRIEAKSAVFTLDQPGGPISPHETTGGSNPSENCVQNCTGDPINTATGEFWETNQDLIIPNNGPLLGFIRSFATSKKDQEQGMGYGWTHNYNMSLKYADADGNVSNSTNAHTITVIQENGSESTFTKLSSGAFGAPARVKAEIFIKSDGSIVFTRDDKNSFVFSADGKLVKVTDKNDNAVNLSYNANNQLNKISNDRNQFIDVTWVSSKISSIVDHAGRGISYEYDSNGNLISVADGNGAVRDYTYDTQHRVISLENSLDGKTTNTYISADDHRIYSQTDPRGNTISLNYSGNTTTITKPNGTVVTENYNEQKQLTSRSEVNGDQYSSFSYIYAANNHIERTRNAFGQVTYAGYNTDGKITSFQNAIGYVTYMTYDKDGNLLSTQNPDGSVYKNTFDENSNLTSTISPEGRKKTFTLNPDGTLATVISEKGNVENSNPADYTTTYGYNAFGYLSSLTDANGSVTKIETDSLGRTTKTIKPEGNVPTANPDDYDSLISYDVMGNIVSTTDEKGNITSATYDAMGNVLTLTNALNQTSSFTYDKVGNLLTSTNALNKTTSYEYDSMNQLVKITDPTGKFSTISYDGLGNVIKTKDSLGRETHQSWNALGQLISSTDAEGKKVEYSYDANGNLLTSKDQLGNITNYSYDVMNRFSSSTDAENRMTATSYTLDGLLSEVTRADGLKESSTYDLAGNVIASTDAAGKVQNWTYNNLNQKNSWTNETANVESYTYGLSGQVLTQTRTDGSIVSYEYDSRDILTKVDYPGSDMDISYTYDSLGRKLTEQKGTSPAIEYAYDSIGHLTSRGPPGSKVSYSYDDLGNMVLMTYPSGRVVNYDYDDEAQLTSFGTNGLGTVTNAYNNRGLKTGTVLPNGVTTSFTYDDAGRNTAFSLSGSDASELYKKNYAYSATGNIIQKDASGSLPALEDFTYDPLSRLIEQKENSDGSVVNAYEYNAVGNLIKNSSIIQTFDDSGKILSSGTKTFGYDDLGNRVTTTDSSDTAKNEGFEWNTANLLTSKTFTKDTETVDIDYVYSADGLLASRSKDGQGTNDFVWDSLGNIPVLLDDGIYEYVYSDERTPIAQIKKSNGAITYLHSDNIGSVVASTNTAGELAGSTDYSPYGVNLGEKLSAFGFAGEWTDPDTNHSYLRARWLDKTTGTFLSRDPKVQTTGDAYGYAAGNPLSLVDPLGLDPFAFMDSPQFLALNDFVGNAADELTMGGTAAFRELAGVDNVNKCSTAAMFGRWTGVAASFVTPGGIAKQGGTTVAKSFERVFGDKNDIQSIASRLNQPTSFSAGIQPSGAIFGPTRSYPRAGNWTNQKIQNYHYLFRPGKFAVESIPAIRASSRLNVADRKEMQRIGSTYGCHSCGTMNPGTKSGNWVGDHQIVTQLNIDFQPIRLYPHCLSCSNEQGKIVWKFITSELN